MGGASMVCLLAVDGELDLGHCSRTERNVAAGRGEHTPGAKAPLFQWGLRPKAEALGYLEQSNFSCKSNSLGPLRDDKERRGESTTGFFPAHAQGQNDGGLGGAGEWEIGWSCGDPAEDGAGYGGVGGFGA